MQIIIPMSGRGSRFAKAGYDKIKPLIEVDGRPMIEHVIGLFPGESDFLFICAEDHLRQTNLRSVLSRIAPKGRIKGIEPHKKGPVWAVLQASAEIRDDEPVLVSYCDFSASWDYERFVEFTRRTKCDGCIPSYRGFHPHSLGPNLYAYLRTDGDRVLEVKEKGAFTSEKMQEFASAGIYYFRSGRLLKSYFDRAIRDDLQLGGEYYASLPYNLLIRDRLDVRVFEMEQFLQWGTPEDLEEYSGWSDWFHNWEGWRPGLKISGTTLIPAAGSGQRFTAAGYRTPKPLIPVDGVPMLSRALSTLPRTTVTSVVVHEGLFENADLRKLVIADSRRPGKLVQTATTQGQAETCLVPASSIDTSDGLLLSACDASFGYQEGRFSKLVADSSVDFVVWTFRNHPHANRNPAQYGWVKADEQGVIQALTCKKPISSDVRKDPGVTGTFWFRHAGIFFEEAKKMISENDRVNGEFYVDNIAARLAVRGMRGRIFDVDHFICFGTPDDVRTYEYWARHFGKQSLRSGTGTKSA